MEKRLKYIAIPATYTYLLKKQKENKEKNMEFVKILGFSGGGSSLASKLRSLYSESFFQLLGTIFKIVQVMFDCRFFNRFRIFLINA